MIYLELFLSFLQVGVFSFGGGYATLPLIEQQVITTHAWLSVEEFTNLITISQMTPGPIALNSATFVGLQIAGIPGAIIATLGCVLPSIIIVTVISYLYKKYQQNRGAKEIFSLLRPVVIALIFSAGLTIIIGSLFGSDGIISMQTLHVDMLIIYGICCFVLIIKKCNPIYVMLLAGVLNFVI